MSTFRYHFGPFLITTDLELPELQPVPRSTRGRDVSIRMSPIKGNMPEEPCIMEYKELERSFSVAINGVARFLITSDRQVVIDPDPNVDLIDLRAYILGWIVGLLCHQEGYLPLHASAVANGSKVTSFLADSGVGKSTLAAFLAERGYRVITDDLCILDLPSGDPTRIIPIAGWLKLWRESWEQIGKIPDEDHRVYSPADKYRLYLDPHPIENAKLTNLVFLERPLPGESTEVLLEPLTAAIALSKVMDLVYMPQYMWLSGQVPELLRRCSAMLGNTQAYRLRAPQDWKSMPTVIEMVERLLLLEN